MPFSTQRGQPFGFGWHRTRFCCRGGKGRCQSTAESYEARFECRPCSGHSLEASSGGAPVAWCPEAASALRRGRGIDDAGSSRHDSRREHPRMLPRRIKVAQCGAERAAVVDGREAVTAIAEPAASERCHFYLCSLPLAHRRVTDRQLLHDQYECALTDSHRVGVDADLHQKLFRFAHHLEFSASIPSQKYP